MNKIINIIPVSDLRQDTVSILKRLKKTSEPLVVTQRGRAAAVMVGVEVYEKSERDKELLFLLANGCKEAEIGEGHDLDTVLSEADMLLDKKN